MTQWRELTDHDAAYLQTGKTMLGQMLNHAHPIEAPELQALYDWCLQQGWQQEIAQLEELGPVLALGVGVGAEIALAASMDWVWVERDDFGWFGLALKRSDRDIFAFPTRMITQRLHDRVAIRIGSLITGTVQNIENLSNADSNPL